MWDVRNMQFFFAGENSVFRCTWHDQGLDTGSNIANAHLSRSSIQKFQDRRDSNKCTWYDQGLDIVSNIAKAWTLDQTLQTHISIVFPFQSSFPLENIQNRHDSNKCCHRLISCWCCLLTSSSHIKLLDCPFVFVCVCLSAMSRHCF